MVATTPRRAGKRRKQREAWRDSIRGVHLATEHECQHLFDHQARKELGISGEEFLRRWDGGEYGHIDDLADDRKVERLMMLIPVVRRTRA